MPYADGGPTCSDNTAPLCRRHHRAKTHSAWDYSVLDRGTYLWTTPNGSSSSATTAAPAHSRANPDHHAPHPGQQPMAGAFALLQPRSCTGEAAVGWFRG